MKTITLFLTMMFTASAVTAQNTFPASGSVGIGTTAPASSSILEVKSTTKGVLLPRMTKAQRDAIASPAVGLLVYQTDNNPGFYVYNAGWKQVTLIAGADRKLGNLIAPTTVNADLLPKTDSSYSLGTSGLSWRDIYFKGGIFYDNARFIGKVRNNTYVGYFSGAISEGSSNVAIGDASLFYNSGDGNSAVGTQSLAQNSTGYHNTGIGTSTSYANQTGRYNTASGYYALYNNTNSYNTANGTEALYKNTSGSDNTGIGYQALYTNSTGYDNTAVGLWAGRYIAAGVKNTAVGALAGQNNTSYSTFVGYNAKGTSGITNAMALGYNTSATASNTIAVGNTSIVSIKGQVNFTTYSDGRFKKNIQENVPGLTFIRMLKPVTYNLDANGINNKLQGNDAVTPASENDNSRMAQEDKAALNAKSKIVYTGFIAQDVEAAAKKLSYNFSGVDAPKNENDLYGLRYAEFVVPLVKAVQELDKDNKELREEIEQLKQTVAALAKNQAAISLDNKTTLDQNKPNPFYGNTVINYNIANAKHAAIVITQTGSGKTIKSINLTPGSKQLALNTDNLTAGAYTYSLIADGKIIESKQMLLKAAND